MKQKIKLLMILGVLCGCLCACGGETMTQGDKYWVDAQKGRNLEAYLTEEGAYIDWETLREEAKNEELSLQQQFKIVLLLCTYEYQCLLEEGDKDFLYRRRLAGEDELKMFRKEYPDSSPYVNAYLKKVNTETDEFWEAFVVTFGTCEYLEALIAAADELDRQTIINLMEGLNEDDMWGIKLKAALMKWLEIHPEEMEDYIMVLNFHEDLRNYEKHRAFLCSLNAPHETNTARGSRSEQWNLISDEKMTIIELVLIAVLVIWGLCCFLGAAFWWDSYSQHPKLFPFAKRRRWQIDIYEWLAYNYGDEAVRKYILFWSAATVIIGSLIFIGLL